MEEKILIIDDEMHLNGSTDKRYKHLSEKDLAIRIHSFLKSQFFEAIFVKTGEEGLKTIENDVDKKIKAVILDIRFTKVHTRMQGSEIFSRIQEINFDLPIIIMTSLPKRKLPGEEDIFKEFVELGASLYIEKRYFTRRSREQINFINSVVRGHEIKYTLKYYESLDYNKKTILDIDITRFEDDVDFSVLKNPRRIFYPMSHYIKQCIEKHPSPLHWTDCAATRDEMLDIEFAKAVFKINDSFLRSSCGRVSALLERLGRAGCKLNIENIIKLGD